MNKVDRDNAILERIYSVWPHYPIDPNGFRHFFGKMAKVNSNFLPRFIDETLNNKCKNLSSSYVIQKRALIDWWAMELGNVTSAFFHTLPFTSL